MPIETLPWDPANNLTSDTARKAYFEAALEDGDPHLIAAALGDIARSNGVVIENFPSPYVADEAFDAGYRAMANDKAREADAIEWANALIGDVENNA